MKEFEVKTSSWHYRFINFMMGNNSFKYIGYDFCTYCRGFLYATIRLAFFALIAIAVGLAFSMFGAATVCDVNSDVVTCDLLPFLNSLPLYMVFPILFVVGVLTTAGLFGGLGLLTFLLVYGFKYLGKGVKKTAIVTKDKVVPEKFSNAAYEVYKNKICRKVKVIQE